MTSVSGLWANPFFDGDVLFCLCLVVGVVLWMIGWRTWAIRLILVVLIPFFVLTLTPCGSWLLMRLENSYPEQTSQPKGVQGLILLGGGLEPMAESLRHQPIYGSSASRVFEALRLAHQNPSLKVLLTGTPGEVSLTRTVFEAHGIDPERLILEDQSSNTIDNARNSYQLIKPDHRPWLLVTSAYHMKRAVKIFEHAGWTVVPYPVDYKTGGSLKTLKSGTTGRQAFWRVLREWGSEVFHR